MIIVGDIGNTETKIGENHIKIDTLLSSSSTT